MTPPPSSEPSTYFRKGFGLKAEVQDDLAADYDGQLVDRLKAENYTLTVGDVTIRLAREFGFCYGVERAVEYAYQTRRKFPDRKVFLVGEIIHNPLVNGRLTEMGVEILERPEPTGAFDFSRIRADDVVIMPAFGVTIDDFAALRDDRLRARRHDVRLGAQRLEARRDVRARRLHRADPRQVLPRGDARDGVAGAASIRTGTTSSSATWTKRGSSATTSKAGCRPRS